MGPRSLTWLLLGFLAVLAARRWLDVVEVRGRSMAPALLPGDRLLVVRCGSPRVGQIVVASDPRDAGRELIKRVAAHDTSGVTLRGDNPPASTDARAFGRLPPEAITWRVVMRYWPLDRAGSVVGGQSPVGGSPA